MIRTATQDELPKTSVALTLLALGLLTLLAILP